MWGAIVTFVKKLESDDLLLLVFLAPIALFFLAVVIGCTGEAIATIITALK
jgi:hypothetical protein